MIIRNEEKVKAEKSRQERETKVLDEFIDSMIHSHLLQDILQVEHLMVLLGKKWKNLKIRKIRQ